MPDTPSITIVKAFTYRGKREETSNKYHFSGTVPSNAAGWKALADAMIASEAQVVTNKTKFVRAYGYEAGNEISVAQIDYEAAPNTPVAGNFSVAANGGIAMSPEACGEVRFRTNERNSRKKWIYLRKYMHDGALDTAGDSLNSTYKGALDAWAGKLIDGTLPGGFKYCGPQGAPAVVKEVKPYANTRELKRRGKRPSR